MGPTTPFDNQRNFIHQICTVSRLLPGRNSMGFHILTKSGCNGYSSGDICSLEQEHLVEKTGTDSKYIAINSSAIDILAD